MVKETEVPWYQSFDCRSGNHSDCMFPDECGCACHKENKLTDENGDEI